MYEAKSTERIIYMKSSPLKTQGFPGNKSSTFKKPSPEWNEVVLFEVTRERGFLSMLSLLQRRGYSKVYGVKRVIFLSKAMSLLSG